MRGRSRPSVVALPGLVSALSIVVALAPGSAPAQAVVPISFAPPVDYTLASGAANLTAGDFDADGNLDLAVVDGPNVSILHGLGDGRFETPVSHAVGEGVFVGQVLGTDLNADGRLDLAVAHTNSNQADVLLNLGGRTFTAPAVLPVGSRPFGVHADDFNGDGKPDLAPARW